MMASETADEVFLVDLSSFTADGSQDSKRWTADELAKKGGVNGFVGITGHGIAPDQLEEAFSLTRKLFDLPYEDKMTAPHPDAVVPHRGYSGFGREKAAAKSALTTQDEAEIERYTNTTDYKESYEIGSEENKINYNIWLPDAILPGFKYFTLGLYWRLNKLARSVLDALIMSLNLTDSEEATIRSLNSGHENQLRLLHYPAIPARSTNEEAFSRLGAHTDFSASMFTLLFQDKNGGLEFQDRRFKGEPRFVAAPPIEGVVYMNIGDMFERISNGLYPSALHRVTIQSSKDERAQKPRYSIPYFVGPRLDAVIRPPASLVKACGRSNFEPTTFEEYATKMYEAVNKY